MVAVAGGGVRGSEPAEAMDACAILLSLSVTRLWSSCVGLLDHEETVSCCLDDSVGWH